MANKIVFEDYSIKVKAAIDERIDIALEECAGELESAVKRNTRVDTGQLKNSWTHRVNTATHTAVIGSPLENAILEEFGTGEHALNGNGRQGGWRYQDARGNWHYTTGKTPQRAFHRAYTGLKNKIISYIQNSFKGLK